MYTAAHGIQWGWVSDIADNTTWPRSATLSLSVLWYEQSIPKIPSSISRSWSAVWQQTCSTFPPLEDWLSTPPQRSPATRRGDDQLGLPRLVFPRSTPYDATCTTFSMAAMPLRALRDAPNPSSCKRASIEEATLANFPYGCPNHYMVEGLLVVSLRWTTIVRARNPRADRPNIGIRFHDSKYSQSFGDDLELTQPRLRTHAKCMTKPQLTYRVICLRGVLFWWHHLYDGSF